MVRVHSAHFGVFQLRATARLEPTCGQGCRCQLLGAGSSITRAYGVLCPCTAIQRAECKLDWEGTRLKGGRRRQGLSEISSLRTRCSST